MNLFSFCHSSCWTRHYVFIWKCLWIDNVEMMVIFSLRHFFLSNKKIPFELIKEIFSITDFSHNFDPLATLLIFVNLFYLTVRWRTTIRQQSLNFREKWGRRGAMFEKKNFCCQILQNKCPPERCKNNLNLQFSIRNLKFEEKLCNNQFEIRSKNWICGRNCCLYNLLRETPGYIDISSNFSRCNSSTRSIS